MRSPASTVARAVLACLMALALLGCWAAVTPGRAQTAATTAPVLAPAARLDADKAVVDRIEAALGRTDVSDATLQQFRADIDPVSTDLQALVTDLAPRLDAAKARLDQLGPKPADKAATEAADITTERQAQEKLYSDLDATVKRAKVLSVQADQLSDTVAGRRRALFARSVLERSASLLSPALWMAVAKDLPSDVRALVYLGQDWWSGVIGKAEGWKVSVVAVLIGILAIIFWPALRISRRFKHRHPEAKPTRLKQALFALWVAFVTMAIPTLLVAAAFGVLNGADFVTFRLQPIARSIQLGTLVVGTMAGLARGLLAPGLPNWRLIKISDASARSLNALTIAIAAIVATFELLAAFNDAIAVALPTAVAVRGIGVLLVAVAMARTLHRIDRIVGAMDQGAVPQSAARNWSGPARILGWTVATVLGVALLTGYVAFGSFITKQIVYLTGLFSLLYLLMILVDQGIGAVLQPKTRIGRTFIVTAGFRRESLEQIAILLSGVLRVVLVVLAVLLMLAPWRIGSGDALATLQGAFFGFNVGDVTISLSTIIVAVVLFIVGIAVTRALQRWLDVTYLPHTHLDTGLRNSIKTSIGYLGVVAAVAVAAGYLGLSFEKVTYVAGALSVGIGFGLQSVVSNFVSGLIILWERAIRVGDWIVVGSDEGFVRRINVRSTEIETFDRATVIVPNQNLMTGVVKNWVRGDRVGRILLPITVGLAAKPEEMRDMLIGIAKDHDRVLKIPSPNVLFASYAGDQMTFNLICFVDDVEAGKRTTSDLLFTIHAALMEKNIIVAPGPAQLASPALEQAIALLMADKDDGARAARRA
ncbi:DUF3772 domain-containing protein [Lichenihabitans sp. Uapishka_5]|uniref:DUF3772 domain-containing protein n=1 Tax=Lichenihabitans sp. Uapishka_5 TaxID=3037302 RepID=UPI0029E7DED0|nr:DUF3772 domain-containing protein [Lichenihabitans sp. Uapishka_5]MDX7952769.1 DUF3772 domain-containing protein [Lichenihabitans sp. Uapishka_5]